MTRLKKQVAKAVLQEELDRVEWNEPSTYTVKDVARAEAANLHWWHEHTPENERADTVRSLAYLRAYLRIAGDDPIYATGLRLYRGVLWMDRSVISRLERDGYLAFKSGENDPGKNPKFEITRAGREWVTSDNWKIPEGRPS